MRDSPESTNSWSEYRRLVMSKFTDYENRIAILEEKYVQLYTQMIIADTKSKMHGTIFGVISGIITALIIKFISNFI